jgi:hypothetical protein
MRAVAHRKSGYTLWKRPRRGAGVLIGLAAAAVGIFLGEHGVGWKYSEVGVGTVLLLWCLLAVFRPEWHRCRFWGAIAAIVALHLSGWIYLANRINHFGFALMFLFVIIEIVLGAAVILRVIPEDYSIMVDHIHRW